MIRKIEVLIVLIAIVLLTLFSASFADPSTETNRYENQTAFYGRDILKEPKGDASSTNALESPTLSEKESIDLNAYFWGVPDFSHQ